MKWITKFFKKSSKSDEVSVIDTIISEYETELQSLITKHGQYSIEVKNFFPTRENRVLDSITTLIGKVEGYKNQTLYYTLTHKYVWLFRDSIDTVSLRLSLDENIKKQQLALTRKEEKKLINFLKKYYEMSKTTEQQGLRNIYE
jgi:hypothetical protein